ncbi:MAG TPA: hypothetical protein VE618_00720, partial [Myxococcaceae bacterium]|nr:hypothetical protein [Myxococcaceae bacterium]
MNHKQIVATCAAALWLASQGCSERAFTPSAPPRNAAAPAVSALPPPPEPLPAQLEIGDGG